MPTVAVEAVAAIMADEAAEEAVGSSRPNKRARTPTSTEQALIYPPPRSTAVQRLRSIEALVKELLRDNEEGEEGEAGVCEHEIDQNRMFDCGCGTNDSYCIRCGEVIHCPECAA